ncbi:aldo/keto reductase [Pseudarthrobacter sp. NPDC080039]|uniref:aldo/keto reductase n=1 Tax=unclassified Pseudarthrobacter TaxID=2647000 RepID=UPI00344F0557
MRYRRLGRTELTVSTVGVGTWQFGGEWGKDFSQADVDAILGRAHDLGITLVDTAECYGDHLSEQLVGKAIERNRDEWVVATKFGHRYHGLHERTQEWSAREVTEQLERSLRALGTDYIDVYQFHSGGDEVFDQDELWEALHGQVQAGKIRHLGISIGSNANVYQTDRALEVGASVIQLVYSRLDREPEHEVLASCERQDLGVLAREALAGGLLSGKYAPGTRFTDPADTRSRRPEEHIQQRLSEVERIRQDEVPPGTDMAAWALAWCLRPPVITAVIPGSKSVEQLESNAAAADLDLAGELRK